MKELKIGERLVLECQASDTEMCEGCTFFKIRGVCTCIKCAGFEREDDTPVKFVEVEGEVVTPDEKKSLIRDARQSGFEEGFGIARELALELVCDTCPERCQECKTSTCDRYKQALERFDVSM